MIYCHSKVFMDQDTRLYILICNLGYTGKTYSEPTSGRSEEDTRPGRTWKKPKDLSVCKSEGFQRKVCLLYRRNREWFGGLLLCCLVLINKAKSK